MPLLNYPLHTPHQPTPVCKAPIASRPSMYHHLHSPFFPLLPPLPSKEAPPRFKSLVWKPLEAQLLSNPSLAPPTASLPLLPPDPSLLTHISYPSLQLSSLCRLLPNSPHAPSPPRPSPYSALPPHNLGSPWLAVGVAARRFPLLPPCRRADQPPPPLPCLRASESSAPTAEQISAGLHSRAACEGEFGASLSHLERGGGRGGEWGGGGGASEAAAREDQSI